MTRTRRGQRGFALLIVLWTLVLLTLLVTQLTAVGRGEARLALNLRTAAAAEAAADGAIVEAIFHLLDSSPAHWPADGRPRDLRLGGARVTVRIDSEAGRVNPNTAQPQLLAALLHAVGADTATATRVAGAIVDWRFPDAQGTADGPGTGGKAAAYRAAGRDYLPPGAHFETIDELGLVLGMTPDLLAGIAPYLTLAHEGDPDPGLAAAPVLAALREAAAGTPLPPAATTLDESVVRITAAATGENASRFARRATVRIGASREGAGSLYQVLRWEALEQPE